MNKQRLLGFAIPIAILFMSASIFQKLYLYSDLNLHAEFAKEFINGSSLPSNFLYYYVISVVSLFDVKNLEHATVYVLSLSVVFKYFVTQYIIAKSFSTKFSNQYLTHIRLVSFAMIFIFSLFFPQILIHKAYYASFPPNVWHNSTTIFLMPFALLLMWYSVKLKEKFDSKTLLVIIILIALNASIKPSYLFVYICAFPIVLVVQKSRLKDLLRILVPVVFAIFCIVLLKFKIYNNADDLNNTIAIKPFFVYNAWLNNSNWSIVFFSLSIASCYAFPFVYLFTNKLTLKNTISFLTLISFGVSIAIFIFVAEMGDRTIHGNFGWQIIIVGYMFFLSTIIQALPDLLKNKKFINLYSVLFFLHTFTGVLYIAYIFYFSTFK